MASGSAATNGERLPSSDDLQPLTKPESNPSGLAIVATVVLTVTAAVIILLSLFEKPPLREVSSGNFCCPDVLDRITNAANTTVDPCEDSYRHGCSAPNPPWSDIYNEATNLRANPVRGFPETTAGRVIAAFYRRCVVSESTRSSVGRHAAEAILKYASITSPMRPERLLELLLELSLTYGLPSILHLELVPSRADSFLSLLHVGLSSACRLRNMYTQRELLGLKNDVLTAVNQALSSAVTLQEVESFFERSHSCSFYEAIANTSQRDTKRSFPRIRVNRTKGISPTIANEVASPLDELFILASPLDELFILTTHITAAQWTQVLGKFLNTDSTSLVPGVPLPVLGTVLQEFLDPVKQPFTTVTALVTSSMQLASRLFLHTRDREGWVRFCELRSRELRPLWIRDKLGSIPAQSQDAAIRRTYQSLVNVVLRKVASFVTADDLGNVTNALVSVRLLLPTDLAPENDTMPTLGVNFAQAYLQGQKYLSRIRAYHIRTLGVGHSFLNDVRKHKIAIRGKTLTVPMRLYTLLKFGKDVDELVTMPTVGVLLATAIWNFVFSGNWSESARKSLLVYRSCLADSLRHVRGFPPNLTHELSWLGLESCVEACRGDNWDHPVDNTQRWNLTRSQAFYMIYVTYNGCKSVASTTSALAFVDVNGLLKSFPDFVATFQCNDTSSSRPTPHCSAGITFTAYHTLVVLEGRLAKGNNCT
ncbi:hypothetical protein HPB48_020833 [Haemaphysalis longicornis]|uniref:Uncharacterized protein n=1 Tax=Haemaphysalis longicornis TaxID=44386 RepID=A0A9J6GKH1_HAELO|nr:hypothetical protein HPB48_020833 [Haemaphysalis longicornis]